MLLNEWTNTLIDLWSVTSYYVTFIIFPNGEMVQLFWAQMLKWCFGCGNFVISNLGVGVDFVPREVVLGVISRDYLPGQFFAQDNTLTTLGTQIFRSCDNYMKYTLLS